MKLIKGQDTIVQPLLRDQSEIITTVEAFGFSMVKLGAPPPPPRICEICAPLPLQGFAKSEHPPPLPLPYFRPSQFFEYLNISIW